MTNVGEEPFEMRTPADTRAASRFPPPPVACGDHLVPITSWREMFLETRVTGVEFDVFWYESVQAGLAYFFRWLGAPRATVLVVWNELGPTHIECRKAGDELVSAPEVDPILAEVTMLFRDARFLQGHVSH